MSAARFGIFITVIPLNDSDTGCASSSGINYRICRVVYTRGKLKNPLLAHPGRHPSRLSGPVYPHKSAAGVPPHALSPYPRPAAGSASTIRTSDCERKSDGAMPVMRLKVFEKANGFW